MKNPEQPNKGEKNWQESFENNAEIYTAREIFDLIQANEFNEFEKEKIRKNLTEFGQKEEDIDLAVKLMACISAVQKAAFDGEQIELQFMPMKRPDAIAGYRSKNDENPKEAYAVYVEGLHETTSDWLKKTKLTLFDREGKPNKNEPIITTEEDLLGVAIHEVRHRFQYQDGFRIFSPEAASAIDNQLRQIMLFTVSYFDKLKKIREKGCKKGGEIVRGINPSEFDSFVIEILANNKIHEGLTLRDFFDLVKIQPPEIK